LPWRLPLENQICHEVLVWASTFSFHHNQWTMNVM
jgi:hypothetical protein